MIEITPFRVDAPDEQLRDLRDRLHRTRWPEAETVDDWSQGMPLAYAQDLCRYWADGYDWRAREARINAFPQFRTEIDGLGIHFVHARSSHADAFPLVLTHGWPGSIVEFLEVIAPLTDPTAHGGEAADAFHVVCPSLPGYGFSDRPSRTGWNVERIARAWSELMAGLGYERYGAQGGDWGAMVTASLGLADPAHVAGIHLNMPVARPDPSTFGDLTPREQEALDRLAHHQEWGTGYSKEQSTRPQTLGYGLVDSPAAQCAWIVEKFWDWTDCDGDPEHALTRDQMLDNVMLYWLPGTGASSGRLYWESFRNAALPPVGTPTGCSIFPHEIIRMSRRWVEQRFSDIRYWNELDRGGHFAAFEQPGIFVDEVRAFFRLVR
ncbi:MAG: putative epoxide hydrolase [Acidimicrobiales bacterium]|jgi:pimeloyl-ACP methyl ester carboxylesterase|nr:putative epoxide hydrolase [Acidimicrobiales bacterium]